MSNITLAIVLAVEDSSPGNLTDLAVMLEHLELPPGVTVLRVDLIPQAQGDALAEAEG